MPKESVGLLTLKYVSLSGLQSRFSFGNPPYPFSVTITGGLLYLSRMYRSMSMKPDGTTWRINIINNDIFRTTGTISLLKMLL